MESTTVEETQVEVGGAPEPDRIEQAAEALHLAQEEAPEEVEPEPEEPAEEPAPEPEEAKEEPEPVNIGHEYKTLRRRQKQLRRKEEAFQAKVSELESKLAEVEAQANLINLIKEDPSAALREFTSRAGTSEDEFYEKMTLQRLGTDPQEQQQESALWKEIKSLREELKQKDQRAEEEARAQQEQARQAAVERAVQSHVQELCSIPNSPEFSSKWQNLANLRPDILEARANYAVWWAMENSPKTTLPELADALDAVIGEEYKFTLDRLNASRQDQGSPEQNLEGLGAPENGKPAAKPQALTLTNNDAAVTSRRGRPMTQSERLQAAANALPDFKQLVGN
ncbi:MAG: hypothetical protein CL414_06505 [Acidimicrobiaceae bacterium]|nr:hypothetical protein [Acidimicrobiaceae bacterium]|tara:strand:+ start:102 stop:1118 length:1017 start_codon:yes stop_codon:yes gene_type:complete